MNTTLEIPDTAEAKAVEIQHWCTCCGSEILDPGLDGCCADCADSMAEALSEGRFAIDSEDRADWLLGKLAALDDEQKRIEANAADMIARIETRRKALDLRFGDELRAWAECQLEGKKSRTLQFLHGKVNFRYQQGGPRVVDKDAAMAYAKAHELDCITVRVSENLRATDYIQLAPVSDGELPPGVELAPDKDLFYVLGRRVELPGSQEVAGGEG